MRHAKLLALAAAIAAPLVIYAQTTSAPATKAKPPSSAPTAAPSSASAIPASNPKSVDDLRAIEARVKDVITKCLPATVGVSMGTAQGSGVIVSKDGVVLTAGHVAAEPNKDCTLILPNGNRVRAKTLGINTAIDSGMIKITDKAPPDGWPYVELGRATDLKAGQWTVALGHPGGYRKDRPPVARLGRVLMANARMLATDNTLINGDSGGPLFDLDGKLIGIHSRIGASTVSNIHVPIDTYRETWDRLAAGEAWGRSILGFDRAGSPAVLGVTAVDDDKGPRVSKVVPESPAARAGVKVGDILSKFNGRDIKNVEELTDLMSRQRPGRTVTLDITREDKPLTIKATLAPRM